MKKVASMLVGLAAVALLCQGCRGSSPVLGSVVQSNASVSPTAGVLPLGAACLPSDEAQPTFSGYGLAEVTVESPAPSCASNVCLVNHMQGRASCPYGQTVEQAATAPACFLPGSALPVTVAVEPQLVGRQADLVATCSCRCGGTGPGPFCACPGGMMCVPSVEPNDALGDSVLAGSYCVLAGTTYDPSITSPACEVSSGDCGSSRPY